MPRPKRPKLVQNVQQDSRVAESVITSTAQKQKATTSPQSSDRFTNGSDDSDGLVKRKRGWQNMSLGGVHEYTMSGAIATETEGPTRSRLPSPKTRAEFSRIVRDSDHVKSQLEKRRGSRAMLTTQAHLASKIPSTVSRKAEPIRLQASSRLKSSTRKPNDQSNLLARADATPQAQHSILEAITFKKRARQPSLLQLAQIQHDANDDLDDEDFEDFRPDDQSTPLVQSFSQPRQPTSNNHLSSRKRKMSSPEIQVPASQSQHGGSPPSSPSSIRQRTSHDLCLNESDHEPEPTLPRLHQTRTPSPQIFSDTFAPPQSSSSPFKPSPKATRQKKLNPRSNDKENPCNHGESLSTSAPPLQSLTTVSHISPTHRSAPPPKPLTTARLQNLLPRRRARRKARETYDVPSSSDVELDTTLLEEEEDELSFHTTTKVRRKKTTASKSKREAVKRNNQTTEMTLKGRRISKTYSRKSELEQQQYDHEHDEDENSSSFDGDSIDDAEGKTGGEFAFGVKAQAEMKRLADKFKEVDDYTLDFEDMTGSSSQMKDAR